MRLFRLLPLSLLVLSAASVSAQPKVISQAHATRHIRLEVGQTRLVHLSQKIVRVSIADPNVADVRVVTPLQVLVTAKGVGYTHLILWGTDDKPLVMAVSCARNLSELRTQLKELFPLEKIQVNSAGELVVLSGEVSDLRLPARAAEVARLHSKQLANLIEVTGNQQVQLEVRFAEVSRSGMRQMGVNFLWRDPSLGGTKYTGGVTAAGVPAGIYAAYPGTTSKAGAPPIAPPSSGDAFNFFFSTGLAKFPFSAILSVLAQEGLAKMLAEPTLVAMSGQEAKFHAGGEVPILIAQQLGQVSVKYKKYGVLLKFVPTVLGKRSISLKMSTEVSEPDPSAGVTLGGYTVPGFKSRSNDTTIRLKDGQSFAIAGLLSDSIKSTIRKVPLLGELPILGALFRSTAYQREETELLVVVRAHLVQPLSDAKGPLLPGEDEINDPNDFELFMLGKIDGDKKEPKSKKRRRQKRKSETGGPSGPIGFVRN